MELCIPDNPDRGGTAGLRCSEHCVRRGKAGQFLLQNRERLLQHCGDIRRQNGVQITQGDAGPVGGMYRPQCCCGTARQKIRHQLCRGMVVAAPGPEGGLLQLTLPVHPAQYRTVGKLFRRKRDKQCGIGVFSIAGGVAHAIGDHAAGLRGRRHHITARTHAEGIG